MRAAHGLAGVGVVPDGAVARELALGLPLVGAPGDALRAPDVRDPGGALAAEVPDGAALLGHAGVDLVDRDPAHVERLQQLEVSPLRRPVHGRRGDVEAAALGGLELVDDLLVRADAGEVDLDAGLLGEAVDEAGRQVVRPHQDVDLARGRQHARADDRRRRDGAGQSGASLEHGPARQAAGRNRRTCVSSHPSPRIFAADRVAASAESRPRSCRGTVDSASDSCVTGKFAPPPPPLTRPSPPPPHPDRTDRKKEPGRQRSRTTPSEPLATPPPPRPPPSGSWARPTWTRSTSSRPPASASSRWRTSRAPATWPTASPRASGRHGVCIAQNGPGITNFVTAIAAAYWAHTPVVVITPETGSNTHGPRRLPGDRAAADLLREDHQVPGPRDPRRRMAESLSRCFDYAMLERGPAQLNIPRDLFYGEIDYEIPQPQRVERGPGGRRASTPPPSCWPAPSSR